MTFFESIIAIIGTIGFASTICGLIFIGRKLQVLDDLDVTVHKMKFNMKVMCDFLTRNNSNFNPSELQALSPLQLTDAGKKLIADIGFDKIFRENQKEFFHCIDEEKPVLKYDVETTAIKSIYFLSEKPYLQALKIYFYNNPDRNLENTAPTLGVYVRDAYLVAHPEIIE